MRRLIYTLAAGTLFLAASCKQNAATATATTAETTKVVETKDVFTTGVVIPTVTSKMDATQSYALYLPKSYTDTTTLPVIIFFDPHGDGTVPLNLYAQLAEENSYILIGSNTSKNGMDLQQAQYAADNLVNEAESRFKVNQRKITLCGFSGGAKVALAAAAENKAIATVIYCGAALPVNPTHPLEFVGFAGTRDMNYTDVVAFNSSLKGTQHIHYLVEWNGKHEFPVADVFSDAFDFLKNGNITNYANKQAGISAQKLAEEQGQKQILLQAFQTQDINWWKQNIALLNSKKKTDPMYERLLGFVSLACYSYSNQLLQQNNLPAAEKILTIYALADPGNKDCEAFTAELKKRKGN